MQSKINFRMAVTGARLQALNENEKDEVPVRLEVSPCTPSAGEVT